MPFVMRPENSFVLDKMPCPYFLTVSGGARHNASIIIMYQQIAHYGERLLLNASAQTSSGDSLITGFGTADSQRFTVENESPSYLEAELVLSRPCD